MGKAAYFPHFEDLWCFAGKLVERKQLFSSFAIVRLRLLMKRAIYVFSALAPVMQLLELLLFISNHPQVFVCVCPCVSVFRETGRINRIFLGAP